MPGGDLEGAVRVVCAGGALFRIGGAGRDCECGRAVGVMAGSVVSMGVSAATTVTVLEMVDPLPLESVQA